MKTIKVERTYITDDGKEFKSKSEAETHEMEEYRKTVPKSSKYVLGRINENGGGWFTKFKHSDFYKAFWKQGRTGNIKYAYKFKTFEEAYNNRGGDKILTLEAATAASEFNKKENVEITKREQKYVCEYDKDPSETGEYITNMGVITWGPDGWTTMETPVFWMRKTTKNTKR